MTFPAYTSYADSRVDWLGEVPQHWQMMALKRLVSMKSGETITSENIDEQGEYPVYGGNGFRGFTHAYTHEGRFVLIGRQGALCGNINYAQGRFWASEHAVVATPRKPVATTWLGEFLRTMNLNQYSVSAAQPGIAVEIIGNLPIVVPPLPEQTAIAAFLDRETGRIDALVEEQRRLIALLKEKRQAVISHAVTKGLNPDASMKPSGIEWLGDVPEHWSMVALKRLVSMKSGETITSESIEEQGQYPVYGGNGLRGFTDRFTHEGRFVLIGRQGALCGNINYAEGRFWASEHAVVATPRMSVATTWLGEFLRNMNLNQYSVSAAQPGIAIEIIGSLPIVVPPLPEQTAIAAFLDRETGKIDALTTEAETAITLLQERRSALISAAVTGKIDVLGLVSAETEAA